MLLLVCRLIALELFLRLLDLIIGEESDAIVKQCETIVTQLNGLLVRSARVIEVLELG